MVLVKRAGGFSLLEVLVAFAILSLSLGVLMQVFGTGLRNAALSEDYSKAVLHAESLLAAAGVEAPLRAGVTERPLDGRYRGRITVSAVALANAVGEGTLSGQGRVEPYRVTVEVFWQGDRERTRSVVLETLRLARVPP